MKKSNPGSSSGQPSVARTNTNDDIPPPNNSNTTSPRVSPSPPASRVSSAAGLSRPNSAAAAAFQQASVAYHEAVMAKRLEVVQQMQAALTDTTTVAYQSITAYSRYLEGLPPYPRCFCTSLCSSWHCTQPSGMTLVASA